MKTLKAKLTGIRPLLMHSAAMVDPNNPVVRAKSAKQKERKLEKKRNPELEDKLRLEIERLEWNGSMYWNTDIGLYIPGENMMATLVAAARREKLGKQFEQGILPIEDTAIKTKMATTDLDKLYKNPEFSFRSAVQINNSRVMSVRPMVPTGWTAIVPIEYDEGIVATKDLERALTTAGSLIGLMDWRPRFGRFACELVE